MAEKKRKERLKKIRKTAKIKAAKVTFGIEKKQFSEWFSEIITRAELADIRYNVKGFIVVMPWAVEVLEKMYDMFENELKKRNHLPCIFPALIPESNFIKEAEHIKGFAPNVFWVTRVGESEIAEKLALRPTSETAFYQLYSLWIRSYKDLPFKRYQRAVVWRYETKATRPFIRSREFYWIETHNCFSSKEEAEKQIREDIEVTELIMHQKLGIPFLPLKRPEWDKFAGALYTIGSDSLMPDGRVIQQPSSHLLGQGFAKVFDIRFRDKDGSENYVWQTCYGPCISRIFASLIAIHGDDNGLILPFSVSPLQVVIVPIYKKESKKIVLEYCEQILKELLEGGIRAKIDDEDKKPGEKFYFWEMKGVPLRLEIGKQEAKSRQLTLFLRDTTQKKKISEKSIVEKIKEEGFGLDKRIKEKADKEFEKAIVEAKSIDDAKKALEQGKIIRCNFCSIDSEGERCGEIIEKQLGASVRGVRADKVEKASGNCMVCGKKAGAVVYIARSY